METTALKDSEVFNIMFSNYNLLAYKLESLKKKKHVKVIDELWNIFTFLELSFLTGRNFVLYVANPHPEAQNIVRRQLKSFRTMLPVRFGMLSIRNHYIFKCFPGQCTEMSTLGSISEFNAEVSRPGFPKLKKKIFK